MKKPPTFARALVRSLIAFTGLLGAAVIVAATTSNASAAQAAPTSAQLTPHAAWSAASVAETVGNSSGATGDTPR